MHDALNLRKLLDAFTQTGDAYTFRTQPFIAISAARAELDALLAEQAWLRAESNDLRMEFDPLAIREENRVLLKVLTEQRQRAEKAEAERNKLIAWLRWCLDNCDDSPEFNFGTAATENMRALLDGRDAAAPEPKP